MESLIPIFGKLQSVFATLGKRESEFKLPQIVVVGSQSTGKSSVIEGIVGRDFLPRGTGIVTRRPLLIHLRCVPGDAPERKYEEWGVIDDDWAVFDHCPDKIFTNFDEVRKEIDEETDRVSGANKGITNIPIILTIYSENVVNLSLIDLPGLVKVPVGDQPKDIEAQTLNMINSYIDNPNCLILAVTPANMDFANSEALKIAKAVDPEGERTLCVLTKLDLMDRGTDATEVLLGKVIEVKLGIIGVVNRAQEDIVSNKTIDDCISNEEKFLEKNYPSLAAKNGIKYLAQTLNKQLMEHIFKCLPDLMDRIEMMTKDCNDKLKICGKPIIDKSKELLGIIHKFSSAFVKTLEGNVNTHNLCGGAQIARLFHIELQERLDSIDPLKGLKPKDVLTAIQNASGTRSTLFVPEIAFELLVKQQMLSFEGPMIQCVDNVQKELSKIIDSCGDKQEMKRFPSLNLRIKDVIANLLRDRVTPTKHVVNDILEMQLAYINVKHPEFADEKLSLMFKSISETSENEEEADAELAQMKKDLLMKPETIKALEKHLGRHLTLREKRDYCITEHMIRVYFGIVRKLLQDLVPKAVMKHFVNYVHENLHTELIKKIYDSQKLDQILKENDKMAQARENALEMLQVLDKASDVVFEIKETQLM